MILLQCWWNTDDFSPLPSTFFRVKCNYNDPCLWTVLPATQLVSSIHLGLPTFNRSLPLLSVCPIAPGAQSLWSEQAQGPCQSQGWPPEEGHIHQALNQLGRGGGCRPWGCCPWLTFSRVRCPQTLQEALRGNELTLTGSSEFLPPQCTPCATPTHSHFPESAHSPPCGPSHFFLHLDPQPLQCAWPSPSMPPVLHPPPTDSPFPKPLTLPRYSAIGVQGNRAPHENSASSPLHLPSTDILGQQGDKRVVLTGEGQNVETGKAAHENPRIRASSSPCPSPASPSDHSIVRSGRRAAEEEGASRQNAPWAGQGCGQ